MIQSFSKNMTFFEQNEAGIIESIESTSTSETSTYIAHHPAFRKEFSILKKNWPSLNEVLYKGPQLTPLIFDIFIQVRTYVIALTTDIKKAFHQVCVKKTDIFRFLWTDVFSDQPKIVRNRFARVIFGVTCLPNLLNEASRKHAKKMWIWHWFYE